MSNQKGGLFVRLSRKQTDNLYQVRREQSNDACGANVLNILGLSSRFITQMRQGKFGMWKEEAGGIIQEYIKEVESGQHNDRILPGKEKSRGKFRWVSSPYYEVPQPSRPGRNTPSLIDRHCWKWSSSQKRELKKWFNTRIPNGYITILGLIGHWVVIGKSANRGDLIIIESQQGGDGGKGSDMNNCGGAGVYIGEEAMDYLEDNVRWRGDSDNNYYSLPLQTMFIGAAEPEYKAEGKFKPTLSRNLSTLTATPIEVL